MGHIAFVCRCQAHERTRNRKKLTKRRECTLRPDIPLRGAGQTLAHCPAIPEQICGQHLPGITLVLQRFDHCLELCERSLPCFAELRNDLRVARSPRQCLPASSRQIDQSVEIGGIEPVFGHGQCAQQSDAVGCTDLRADCQGILDFRRVEHIANVINGNATRFEHGSEHACLLVGTAEDGMVAKAPATD